MIDSALLGQTAAKCMEYMDEADHLHGGGVVAVAIVVIVQDAAKDMTFTRTFCSDEMHYRQLGIIQAGADCIKIGLKPTDSEEDDDDEDDDDDVPGSPR